MFGAQRIEASHFSRHPKPVYGTTQFLLSFMDIVHYSAD